MVCIIAFYVPCEEKLRQERFILFQRKINAKNSLTRTDSLLFRQADPISMELCSCGIALCSFGIMLRFCGIVLCSCGVMLRFCNKKSTAAYIADQG